MNKSHLLINEPALQVLPSLAKSIGLEEAIILQQLHYWLNNSKVDGRIDDGEKWIYNSYQEWQENFPFWSVQQIQRIFLNLEKGGVVISAKLDAKKHDQTKFYRIDYDALCTMEYIKIDSSMVSESDNVNKELHRLPENTKDIFLSTPEVDVNDLSNDLNNGLDMKDIIARANKSVDSRLAMANFPGAKREARIASIQSYFGERFRINAESKKWRDFARYVDDRQQNFGEDVKVFVSWLYGQKNFDLAFWPPSKMQEFWPSAFMVEEKKSSMFETLT